MILFLVLSQNLFIQLNTFQCVISTDGSTTALFLFYPSGSIQWTTGVDDGGMNGLGGNPASAGIEGASQPPFLIPGSNTPSIIDIASTTNVDMPGAWVFRVDMSTIIFPGTFC